MASHSHVDSRVQERRLRPIYDWLDSGNNKKALQEADKVLKKQPNFLCAKVLKALALQRLGREQECEEILDSVCSQVPTDEATLQAITICYRAIHKPNKICDIYSAAAKKDPQNEELLTHLFMSYVRVGDYRKQHQHAMSLYKLRPKNPYYFWAVMSVVMQAKNDKNMEKSVALKLAEKMVTKFVSEGKIEAEQEVQLYLIILEMQGKYEEALDIIEGELGEKLKSLVTTAVKRIELLMKLERWKEVNVLLKCQLEKNPDSWIDYKNYLETVLKLYKDYRKLEGTNEIYDNRVPIRVPNQAKKEECIMWYEADYTPEMAKKFVETIIENEKNNKKILRGPYLAQLELYKLMSEESLDPEGVLGNITDLVVEYFNKFGDKPICVSDLKPYLPLLGNVSNSFLFKLFPDLPDVLGKENHVLLKHISQLQLSRMLGFHKKMSQYEKVILCNILVRFYNDSKKLISPDKLPTDFVIGDPYVIILSHVLFSLYQETKNRTYIIKAIYHLEDALVQSPSNFHFKLLLVKFYLLLGAGQQAFYYYEHLETKYIQLDSMGFLIAPSGYDLGNFSSSVALYDTTLKFFVGNTNDSVDHLTYAYKYGSFLKIQEFIEFRDRLNDSLHYTLCTVEKALHDLLWTPDYSTSELVMKNMDVKPGANKISWGNLRDNRDLNVIVSYEPPENQLSENSIKKSFENLKTYVRLRDAIINSLVAVYYFVNDVQNEQKGDCLQNSESDSIKSVLVKQLNELNSIGSELCWELVNDGIQDVISTPPSPRLKELLKLPFRKLMRDLINIILLIDTQQSEDQTISQYIESASKNIRYANDTAITNLKNKTVPPKGVLEILVAVSELFAICATLLGSLKCHIRRLRKTLKRGKQKKEDDGNNDLNAFKTLLKVLTDSIQELYEALNEHNELTFINQITSEIKALNLAQSNNDFSSIEKKLSESYSASILEIKQFLQKKQVYCYFLAA